MNGLTIPSLDTACDISIVIVTHRTRDHVRNCLRTLFQEGGLDGLHAQVIVVDNASGDGTASLCRAEFPNAILLENEQNQGFSRGNNQGMEAAKGRNILLLNPDTLVPRGELAKCIRWLEAQPLQVAAMSCRVQSVDGSIQEECSRRIITPWSECCQALLLDRIFKNSDIFNRAKFVGWDRRDARHVPALLGAFMLMRRTAVEIIGGLDERFFLMYEDMDWCKRASDAGKEIWFWPGAYITHLGGGFWKQEPVITYANQHISAIAYFRKHHPRAVGVVRAVSRLGMEIKIAGLRAALRRDPHNSTVDRHLRQTLAARETLRTGTPMDYGKWKQTAQNETVSV